MISHPGDIWLSATEEGKAYVFGLASSPDRQALGTIAANNVPPFIDALLRCFPRNGAARMKQLTSEREFVKTVRESLPFAIEPAYGWKRKATVAHAHLGQHRQLYSNHYIGAMPLLGRLTPLQLRELARLAQEELRLTPWQGILLPNIAPGETDRIKRALHATGLETSPKIRPCAVARLFRCNGLCIGSGGYTGGWKFSGSTAGKRFRSGSPDGLCQILRCACPLPHTLLARSAGRYDLYAQDRFSQNGAGPSRFGQLLASDITLEEAAHILNARHQ